MGFETWNFHKECNLSRVFQKIMTKVFSFFFFFYTVSKHITQCYAQNRLIDRKDLSLLLYSLNSLSNTSVQSGKQCAFYILTLIGFLNVYSSYIVYEKC